MKNLHHDDLKMRSYLNSKLTTIEEKITVFKWRTRMQRFGSNFRRSFARIECPLCNEHEDSQLLSLTCPRVKENIDVIVEYEELFNENVPEKLITTLRKIEKMRDEKSEDKEA